MRGSDNRPPHFLFLYGGSNGILEKELLEIADDLLLAADNYVIEEFPTVAKDNVIALKEATSIFLSNIKDIYEKINGFNLFKKAEHKLKELENGKGKSSPKVVEEYRRNIMTYKNYQITKEEFSIFISQLEKYQKSLNNYLGQTIETIYLYNDGNTVEIYQLVGDLSQAVTQDVASRGGGLSARFSASARNNTSVFQKMILANKNENVTKTYQEVLIRGNESREYLTKKGMLIFWYPNQVWKKMYVAGGAGDIGEAYLSFMLDDERMNLINGNDMEWDIDIFMISGVKLVDNISGLLKGDFSVGNIQYAAKAEGSSVMGYRQVIKLANDINNSTPEQVVEIMQKEYNKILMKEKKKSGRRNKMAEVVGDSVDNVLIDFTKKRMK